MTYRCFRKKNAVPNLQVSPPTLTYKEWENIKRVTSFPLSLVHSLLAQDFNSSRERKLSLRYFWQAEEDRMSIIALLYWWDFSDTVVYRETLTAVISQDEAFVLNAFSWPACSNVLYFCTF